MYVRIGARIKRAREDKYLSQADLGAKLGVTATAINYYEKGKRKISIDDLYRLAVVLEKPLDYFLTEDAQLVAEKKRLPANEKESYYDLMGIPVLGAVRAGEPSEAQQRVIGCLPLPREIAGGGYFALRIKGDSMINEGICEGDLVLIRRQSHVDFNGQIICALVNGENTLKIFIIEKERILLRAANRSYLDIVLKNERELTIQGVYAGVFKFPAGPKPGLST